MISQNDDYGRDYLAGLKDVLGGNYESRVTVATYEDIGPYDRSQIVKLKATTATLLDRRDAGNSPRSRSARPTRSAGGR